MFPSSPYARTNDFSFNCICTLSRLSAFRGRARTTTCNSCIWIVDSRMALAPLFSFKEMRQLNSKILQLFFLRLKHPVPSLSVASSQLCIFSLFFSKKKPQTIQLKLPYSGLSTQTPPFHHAVHTSGLCLYIVTLYLSFRIAYATITTSPQSLLKSVSLSRLYA